jgi:hypothetical protein
MIVGSMSRHPAAFVALVLVAACGAEKAAPVSTPSRAVAEPDDCPVGPGWRVDGGFGRCGLDLSRVGVDGGGRGD